LGVAGPIVSDPPRRRGRSAISSSLLPWRSSGDGGPSAVVGDPQHQLAAVTDVDVDHDVGRLA
jgi:hypothetical protein